MQRYYTPTAGELLIIYTLATVLFFILNVWLTRWIFKINKIVRHLEEISAKLDRKKTPACDEETDLPGRWDYLKS